MISFINFQEKKMGLLLAHHDTIISPKKCKITELNPVVLQLKTHTHTKPARI